MNAFIYGLIIHFKMNLRDKELIIFYYLVPLLFYLFMGGVFTSIMPDSYKTIIQSMSIFGIAMGGLLGSPYPLIEVFHTDIKKSYKVAQIPLFALILTNVISAYIHLKIMSCIIFISAPILFNALIPTNIFTYILSLNLYLIATLCIGTIFGLFINNASKLSMISQIIFLPSIVLSGIMFPINLLPAFLNNLGYLLPATQCFKLMNSYNYQSIIILVCIIISSILIIGYKTKHDNSN